MCIRKADQMLQCPSKPVPEPGSEDKGEEWPPSTCDSLQKLYTQYQQSFADALGEQEED